MAWAGTRFPCSLVFGFFRAANYKARGYAMVGRHERGTMPRYEYRKLNPTPNAERAFLSWIGHLDQEFLNRDSDHRSMVVRNGLHEIYLGRPYAEPDNATPLATEVLVNSFDPRNATLEPEYYGDVDAAKYAERKPLIWFWMMYDRSPLGLNHWLGYRFAPCSPTIYSNTAERM